MKIGILGGGCFWKTWGIPFETIDMNTPYGQPADCLCKGMISSHEVYTLQRHGKLHEISPEKVPSQANTYAFYQKNVNFVIQVTSSGSLREDDKDGDIVLFDQVIDYSRKRPDSLYKPVIKKYTNLDFSMPVSKNLLNFAHDILTQYTIKHHFKGTLLTEDGPRFSTLAESKMYKIWGADFVNQTSCPELYFLRELKIPVLAITMITNKIEFNCGGKILTSDISKSVKMFGENIAKAIRLIIENIPEDFSLEIYQTDPYDVSEFNLRGNI